MNEVQKFTQDPTTYIGERKKKEAFSEIYNILLKLKINSLLDVGCATGDFIYYMPDQIHCTGVDISETLIKKTKEIEKHNFLLMDIIKDDLSDLKDKFDVVTVLGTLHVFLDFKPLLNRIIDEINPNYLIIHSPFNIAPLDVRTYYKNSLSSDMQYQSAYNFFSFETMKKYFQEKGIIDYNFIPFNMKSTLSQDTDYPTRNYHIFLNDGEKYFTNGMNIIFKEYILLLNLNSR